VVSRKEIPGRMQGQKYQHTESFHVLSCSRLYKHTGKRKKKGEKVVVENTDMMRVSSSVSALVWKASCTFKGNDGLEMRGSREAWARARKAHDNNTARASTSVVECM
jgi:NADH pyrophosphatase NudC (nudix superfamily)